MFITSQNFLAFSGSFFRFLIKGHDDSESKRGDFGIIIFQYSIILFPLNVNVK